MIILSENSVLLFISSNRFSLLCDLQFADKTK